VTDSPTPVTDNESVTGPLDEALAQVRTLLLDPDQLVRAVASGRRRSAVPSWRKVELRPVDLKAGRSLQVTAYDERQAHTSNEAYGAGAQVAVDMLLAEPFGNWHVETVDATVQLRVTKRGAAQVHRGAPVASAAAASATADATRVHDRAKPRLLDPADPLWLALGVADAHGRIKPSRQDKYRQVEEFLRALDPVLGDVLASRSALGDDGRPLEVVDLGCGNAALTFATYRFLTGPRGLDVHLTGVDVKAQARDHGTAVAAELGWAGHVDFVQAAVMDAPLDGADIVLALHACDTATDEALARGVAWKAPLILASPCCHHDIQRQLTAATAPQPHAALVRHGILRERFADVLTDALRASLLRLAGYRVEVLEFVGSTHTPRNTLIRAVHTGAAPTPEQVADYRALTQAWGVVPHLQSLLGDLTGP
jgi:SAM-dependent methyltransferase